MTFQSYIQNGSGTNTISGVVNGTNPLFTLPIAPDQLQLYLNGQLQLDAAIGDFDMWDFEWTSNPMLGTATITFSASSIPGVDDILVAWVFNYV